MVGTSNGVLHFGHTNVPAGFVDPHCGHAIKPADPIVTFVPPDSVTRPLAANLLAGTFPHSAFQYPNRGNYPPRLDKREKGEKCEIPGYTLAQRRSTNLST